MMKFFEKFPEILAVMSTRKNGNMGVDFNGKKSLNANRQKFFKKNGIAENNVISALLSHGENIQVVHRGYQPRFIPKCDGLISGDENTFLSITVADCYPVLFFDPTAKIISLLHIGWRGAVSGIIAKTIGYNLIKGSNLATFSVEVGPGICQDHFEFDQADLGRLGAYNDKKYYRCGSGKKVFVDIKKIMQSELARSGVPEKNIKFSPECTFCHPEKYFSYRRDGKNAAGQIDTMMVILGVDEDGKKVKGKTISKEKRLAFA